MVTFRSLPKVSSAANTAALPTRASVVNTRTDTGCFIVVSPVRHSAFRERLRIGENVPDRFARGGDGVGELCVRVLQESDHFEQQLLVALPKLRQWDFDLSVVESPHLIEQVIDLVLERELR